MRSTTLCKLCSSHCAMLPVYRCHRCCTCACSHIFGPWHICWDPVLDNEHIFKELLHLLEQGAHCQAYGGAH